LRILFFENNKLPDVNSYLYTISSIPFLLLYPKYLFQFVILILINGFGRSVLGQRSASTPRMLPPLYLSI
jgi:hypothetical protein